MAFSGRPTGALSPTRPVGPGAMNPFAKIAERLLKGGPSETQNDKQMLRGLDERYDRAKMDRRALESQWLLNLAMYMGQQWLQWDQAARTLQRPNVPPWKVLSVSNYVRVTALQAYGRVVHNRPQAKVQPSNDSPEAEESARAADKVLEYLWGVTNSKKAMDKTLLWAIIVGTGLVKACWDPARGDIVGPDPATGEPMHMGEVSVYPVSPFEFYPEPNCHELEDMQWVFHTTLRPASYIRERYNDENGKPIDLEDENFQQTETFEAQLRNITNGGEQHGGTPKGVIVKEYWERPGANYPDGRYVVYAQDRVLYQGPNPYKYSPIPFIQVRGQPVPGRFWGEAFVTDLIDAQRNYNKSRSQAIEIRNLMSKPKWLLPNGALPPGKAITSAPGEMVTYNPVGNLKPEPVKGEPIPPSFFQDQSTSLREMYDISAQHPIGFGTTGVRSALAIAYLQEQDNTRLGPLSGEYQDAIEDLEEAKLLLAKQFYTETRTVSVTGPNNAVEVLHFQADTIPHDVSVHVQAGAALPMSRVARQQFVLQLWQMQPPLITDPKVALKMMEFGDIEGLYDDVTQDVRQAERENERLKAGQQVLARDFHNHAAHIHEHDSVRKGEEYEQMPPELQNNFDAHVQKHKEFQALQQQQQPQQPPLPRPQQPEEPDLFGDDGGGGEGGPHEHQQQAGTVKTGPEAGQHDPYAARIEQMAHSGGASLA